MDRRRARTRLPSLSPLPAIYDVLEKLRSGEALNAKDKVVHEQGLVSELREGEAFRLQGRAARATAPS